MTEHRTLLRASARRLLTSAVLLLATLLPERASGQVAVGDSLWQLGRTDEAAQAYRRALAEDRNSVRANFRVAQTLAWNNNIDSALVLIRAARERVPNDPDLLITEALYLSWGRRFRESLVRYDSVIVAHPGPDMIPARVARARVLSWAGRLDEARAGYDQILQMDPQNRAARFGRAQVTSWSGDLEGASLALTTLREEDPNDVGVLIALASARTWQGYLGTAEALAARAAALDSTNPDVRTIQENLRTQRASKVDLASWWSEDSERNLNRWQTIGWRQTVGNGLRLGASAGFLDATDPFRRSARRLAEVSLGVPVPGGTISAVLGARSIDPPAAPGVPAGVTRQVFTGRLGAQARLSPRLSATASVARWPFDEVAVVAPLALDITQWDLAVEWKPRLDVSIVGSNGQFDYSDGNRRLNWSARGTYRLSPNLSIGAFTSGFAFSRPDAPGRRNGYFSPSRFLATEATVAWAREGTRWSSGLSGGLGTQRIESRALQSQWHADVRVARRIATRWQVELFAGKSTSAAASAVGAYDYTTAALTLRRAF